jgi:tetraacyldisaccharide 4'-kinase
LREPISSLKRTHAVIITRANQVEQEELMRLEKKLLSINTELVIAHAVHKPSAVIDSNENETSIESLRQKKVLAFCGIGNPEAFFATCRSLDAELLATESLDDHYHYQQSDIDRLSKTALAAKAELVLTTEKDLVKINPAWLSKAPVPFACLRIELELTKGGERITELIRRACAGKIAASA